jgi:putative ABC transport system permease protein
MWAACSWRAARNSRGAARASSLRLVENLAPGARSTDSRGSLRLGSLLVAAQVALSLVLLIGTGLLLRSLSALMTTDLRFNTQHLLATAVDLPYEDVSLRLQFPNG